MSRIQISDHGQELPIVHTFPSTLGASDPKFEDGYYSGVVQGKSLQPPPAPENAARESPPEPDFSLKQTGEYFRNSEHERILHIPYTNYRGERRIRSLLPLRLWYGATDWHPEPQWLLEALDTERLELRSFALSGFADSTGTPTKAPPATDAPQPSIMSGIVSVTLRLPSGKEFRQTWPTSALHRLQHPGVMDKDPGYLHYLAHGPWEIWQVHPGPLAPQEYGLVVVDLVHNRILSQQTATDLESILLTYVTQTWTQKERSDTCPSLPAFLRVQPHGETVLVDDEKGPPWYTTADTPAHRFSALYRAGRIRALTSLGGTSYLPVPQNDLRKVLEISHQIARNTSSLLTYTVDLSPLQIERFEHPRTGVPQWRSLQKRLLSLGFRLSEAEKEIWNQRICP